VATANPQMAAMSHDLLARVALGLPIEPYERKFYRQAVVEHTALVEAITDGQVEAAGRIAREHFSMSTRTLRAVISRGRRRPHRDRGPCRGRRGELDPRARHYRPRRSLSLASASSSSASPSASERRSCT